MYRIAVFARNHKEYLDRASEISIKDPSQLVTFRSAKLWSGAKKALNGQETIKIYLAPIGSDSTVQYEATVKAIKLNPSEGDPETGSLLAAALSETKAEGLWGKTLYGLAHCRRIPKVPFSAFVKAVDGVPLSDNFAYSYALVRELDSSIDLHPEEIVEPGKYFEGALSQVTVNAYERNPAAREACVKHYGANCAVCGFNFGAVYGEIGLGFIHVHHLKPLASIKIGYQVDPMKDLRPVCPNCHSMLHRRMPPYSIDELASLVNMNTKA